MSKKIAVAIVHGIGRQEPNFAEEIIRELTDRFASVIGGRSPAPRGEVVMRPVYWAPVLQAPEEQLWINLRKGGDLDFISLRRFMVNFAADAIAYQPAPKDRKVYDAVHIRFAETLKGLADEAGPTAPLCVIAHSLGTVIASNYLYDLQVDPRRRIISAAVRKKIGDTPLELGQTLTLFYTLGSPIALWSLRYEGFGKPIAVPSPGLKEHYPNLGKVAEWINFYDEDDVIGYPLKTLNQFYRDAVTEDRPINAGGLLSSWNPLSHEGYWTDDDVTKPIAGALTKVWKTVNP